MVRAQGPTPQLWYLQGAYVSGPQAVQSAEAMIDRAVAAGYTGVVLWDSSFEYFGLPSGPPSNAPYVQQVLNYAQAKGLQTTAPLPPLGYSNDMLQFNPSWSEAQRIVGPQFQVDPTGTQLQLLNSFPGLLNPGFESGQVDWFALGDPGLGVDWSVAHSGNASAVINNAPNDARLVQGITLTPWRQYHLQVFYKTQNFHSSWGLEILDPSGTPRFYSDVNASGTNDWTELDFAFNSQDLTNATIYMGVWGGSSGTLWIDDVLLEETALVYVTRGRDGVPLTVYDPNNPGSVYQEGADYNYISDPRMNAGGNPFTDLYHPPPVVTLPGTTTLSPGQVVAMDFYSVFPGPSLDVSMCLSDENVLNFRSQNAQAIGSVVPNGTGLFLGFDEIRQMNSCATCRAKNMSAAQLLDWSVAQTIQTYQAAVPNAPLYIWGDMFDPNQNAVSHYFSVEGDLTGSWSGLPANVTIMNWNLGNLATALNWFSGQNSNQPIAHQQIIAGYYDSGDGWGAAQSEVADANGIPGVMGLMYTTWSNDYSQLENFANGARAAWSSYLNTVPAGPPVVVGPIDPGPLPIIRFQSQTTTPGATAAIGRVRR